MLPRGINEWPPPTANVHPLSCYTVFIISSPVNEEQPTRRLNMEQILDVKSVRRARRCLSRVEAEVLSGGMQFKLRGVIRGVSAFWSHITH